MGLGTCAVARDGWGCDAAQTGCSLAAEVICRKGGSHGPGTHSFVI